MNVPSPNLPRGVQALLFESAERRRRLEDAVVRVVVLRAARELSPEAVAAELAERKGKTRGKRLEEK